jgi:hypothetical protein
MIIGHRTKPDSQRTIVFKVTFPNANGGIDSYEMERVDAENAIAKFARFESRCRDEVRATKDW